MATKRKGKKKAKLNAAKPVVTIYIQPDGTPFPPYCFLDGNGQKHPPQVYWQALNPAIKYQIDFTNPPCPFKKIPSPFRTDANGLTETLTVDKNCVNPVYAYTITPVSFAFKVKGLSTPIGVIMSGGGIIIES